MLSLSVCLSICLSVYPPSSSGTQARLAVARLITRQCQGDSDGHGEKMKRLVGNRKKRKRDRVPEDGDEAEGGEEGDDIDEDNEDNDEQEENDDANRVGSRVDRGGGSAQFITSTFRPELVEAADKVRTRRGREEKTSYVS